MFRKGLDPELRRDLHLLDFNNFQELVDKALKDERGKVEYEATRKRPREVAQPTGSGTQKRRVWIPYSDVPHNSFAPRTSGYAPRPPRPTTTPTYAHGTGYHPPMTTSSGLTCFKCGNPG